jgi:hypothetical protein
MSGRLPASQAARGSDGKQLAVAHLCELSRDTLLGIRRGFQASDYDAVCRDNLSRAARLC